MENLEIYNKVKAVPENAKKSIGGGKLRGMTDINPMWRIKVLTELFGACGIGWYYEVTNQWKEEGAGEVACFVNINLYIKVDGEWSKPIFGNGGSKMVALEKGNPVLSDECYKMATTDAISVASKQLGIGADVYWDKDKTKYSTTSEEKKESPKEEMPKAVTSKPQTRSNPVPEQTQPSQEMSRDEMVAFLKARISKETVEKLLVDLKDRGIKVETVCRAYGVQDIVMLNNNKYQNLIQHYDKLLEMQGE